MKLLLFVLYQLLVVAASAQKNNQDTSITGNTTISITDTIMRPVELRFVSGRIKDVKTGEGIPGATVVVKRTQKGTVTDNDGNFKIEIDKGDKLVISLVGISSFEMDPDKTNGGTPRGSFKIESKQSVYLSQTTQTQTTSVNSFPVPYPAPSSMYSFPAKIFARIQFLYQADSILKRGLDECGYDEKRYYYIPRGFALVTQMEQIHGDGSSRPMPDRWNSKIANDLNNPWDYIKALFSTSTGFYRVLVLLVTDIDHSAGKSSISESEARKWLSSGYGSLPTGIRNVKLTSNYNCTLLVYHYTKQPGEQAQQVFPGPLTGKMHYEKSRLSKYIK